MAHFMGLGFGFEAKDKNLLSFQQQVQSGFAGISAQLTQLNAVAQSAQAPLTTMAAIASNTNTAAIDQLSASVANLSASVNDLGSKVKPAKEKFADFADGMKLRLGIMQKGFHYTRVAFSYFMDTLRGGAKLALDFGKAVVGGALEKAKHMTDAFVTSQENLTTSYEGLLIQSSKTAKAQLSNLGVTDKLSKYAAKATGIFLSQNTSVEENSQALVGWEKSGKALSRVGLKGAADLAKMNAVYGINTMELTSSLQVAGTTLKMTDAQTARFTAAMFEAGQEVKNVGGVMGTIPKIVDLANRRLQTFGGDTQRANLGKFTDDIAITTKAFGKLGLKGEDASAIVMGITEHLVSSGEDFTAMFQGVGSQLDDFRLQTTIVGGNVDKAFDIMKEGPGGFLKGLKMIRDQIGDDQEKLGKFTQFANARFSKVLGGPEMTAKVIGSLGTVAMSQLDGIQALSKGLDNVGKSTRKGFESGLTLADRFERAVGAGMMKFRNFGRETARNMVHGVGRSFKELNASLAETVQKGGFAGDVIKKLSEMHQIGALALLPKEWQATGAVFQTMAKQLGPAMDILGKFGINFSTLTSPVGLLISGVMIFGVMVKKYGGDTGKVFKEIEYWINKALDKLVEFTKTLPALGGQIADLITGLDSGGLGKGMGGKLVTIFENLYGFIAPIAKALQPIILGAINRALAWTFSPDRKWGDRFEGFLTDLGGFVKQATNMTPKELVEALGTMFLNAVYAGLGYAWRIAQSWASDNKLLIIGAILSVHMLGAIREGFDAAFALGGGAGIQTGLTKAFGPTVTALINTKMNGLGDVLVSASSKLMGSANPLLKYMGTEMANAMMSPIKYAFAIGFFVNLTQELMTLGTRMGDIAAKAKTTGEAVDGMSKEFGRSILRSLPIVGGTLAEMADKLNHYLDHVNDVKRKSITMLSAAGEEGKKALEKSMNFQEANRQGTVGGIMGWFQTVASAESEANKKLVESIKKRKELQGPIEIPAVVAPKSPGEVFANLIKGAAKNATATADTAGEQSAKIMDGIKEKSYKTATESSEIFTRQMARAKTPQAARTLMEGMRKAFEDGAKSIDETLTSFFNKQAEKFASFAQKVEQAVMRINSSLTSMRNVMVLSETIRKAQGETGAGGELSKPTRLLDNAEQWQKTLVEATDDPYWARLYVAEFINQMKTLQDEVINLRTAFVASGGNSGGGGNTGGGSSTPHGRRSK